jgi:N utilization substance protein B
MWKIEEMAKIDVAILRLAVWELFFEKETPKKTVIDEAVELAKEFGNEKAPAFINGVLGRIYDAEIQKSGTV